MTKKKTAKKPKKELPMNLSRFSLLAGVFAFAVIGAGAYSLVTNSNHSVEQSAATSDYNFDVNRDGKIDEIDARYVLDNWQTTNTAADINRDGIVNVADLKILVEQVD